jgi:DNA invertase Pin-like site-specific DNA recombinase
MKVWGYTRPLFVADDPSTDVDELHELGVDNVVVENGHRSIEERSRLLYLTQRGDHLVVTSLERLAPRLVDLVHALIAFNDRGVVLRSEDLPDLDTSSGPAVELLGTLSGYASRIVSHTTRDGLRAASKPVGRPPRLDAAGIAMVHELRNVGRSVPHIARVLQVSNTTVYRALGEDSSTR